MSFLILLAYRELLFSGHLLRRKDFATLHERVRACRTNTARRYSTEQVCQALDMACIWYPKHVLCLQRSSAATRLLRRSGIAAEMVLGAQLLPFRAHAWVEVDGAVVNDKPYMHEIYQVLDRF